MSSNAPLLGVAVSLLWIAVGWVAGQPTFQIGTNGLRRGYYGPANPELLPEYPEVRDDDSAARLALAPRNEAGRRWYSDDERVGRNLDQIGGGNLLRRGLGDREDRNLDQIGGDATEPWDRIRVPSIAVKSTTFHVSDAASGTDESVKRNIDEIDRTAFDNFFKRNIDEIDRVGWTGFSKRLAVDYDSADGTGQG